MATNTKRTTVKVTADSTPADLTAGITAGSKLSDIAAGVEALTRLDSAVAVRTFGTTLAVKREVGRLLTLAVQHARTSGADASKVGADGAAITFAHVSAAVGQSGTAWSWAGRTRSTLSDDLNAWHDCTPARIRTFTTLTDDARTLGTRKLSATNVQHAVQWCHADANPARTTNRADGTRSDLHKRVEITGDDRMAAATALATIDSTGGDAVAAPLAVKVNGATITTPAIITPAVLHGWSDAELSAVIVACEGERKRRAAARDGKPIAVPAVPTPAAATTAVVDSVAAAPVPDVAAILAALAAAGITLAPAAA